LIQTEHGQIVVNCFNQSTLEILQRNQMKLVLVKTVGSSSSQPEFIMLHLRLVFTSEGVVVGVVIRSTNSAYNSDACDPVKTALSESQAEAEE